MDSRYPVRSRTVSEELDKRAPSQGDVRDVTIDVKDVPQRESATAPRSSELLGQTAPFNSITIESALPSAETRTEGVKEEGVSESLVSIVLAESNFMENPVSESWCEPGAAAGGQTETDHTANIIVKDGAGGSPIHLQIPPQLQIGWALPQAKESTFEAPSLQLSTPVASTSGVPPSPALYDESRMTGSTADFEGERNRSQTRTPSLFSSSIYYRPDSMKSIFSTATADHMDNTPTIRGRGNEHTINSFGASDDNNYYYAAPGAAGASRGPGEEENLARGRIHSLFTTGHAGVQDPNEFRRGFSQSSIQTANSQPRDRAGGVQKNSAAMDGALGGRYEVGGLQAHRPSVLFPVLRRRRFIVPRFLRGTVGPFFNAFFTPRLAKLSFLTLFFNIVGIVINTRIDAQSTELTSSARTSACQQVAFIYVSLNYSSLATIILGLAAWTQVKAFQLYKVDHERKTVVRTGFLSVCETIVIYELIFLVVWTLVVLLLVLSGSTWACLFDAPLNIAFAYPSAFIVWVLLWMLLRMFDLHKTHISSQFTTCGYLEKGADESFGDNLSLFLTYTCKKLKIKTNTWRREIYQAAIKGNISVMKELIAEAEELLGPDFAKYYYASPPFYCFRHMVKSRLNPVHIAAASGDTRMLHILHSHGFDLNAHDKIRQSKFTLNSLYRTLTKTIVPSSLWEKKRGMRVRANAGQHTKTNTLLTPLHVATLTGQLDAIKWLVRRGANVNALAISPIVSESIPPVFFADSVPVLRTLLDCQANILLVPAGGTHMTLTVLHQAYLNGSRVLCRLLEDWGGDYACTWLHAATAADDWKTVLQLLRLGADPNCIGDPIESVHKRTALHWAGVVGAFHSAQALLFYGASVNKRDLGGRTALHWAARHNHLNIIELLLRSGADSTILDHNGMNPICCAAETDDTDDEIIRAFVKAGCDINCRCRGGNTALHIAIKLGHRRAACVLLRNGADYQIENKDKKRPLECTNSSELQYIIKKQIGVRDVMISYTHSHTQLASLVREALERDHITTWMDAKDQSGIRAGAVWREEIARGIQNCKVVLAIVSEDYPKSQWCLKELAIAKEASKPLIGIKLSDAAYFPDILQVYLYSRQIVSFAGAIREADYSDPRRVLLSFHEGELTSCLKRLKDGIKDQLQISRRAASRRERTGRGGGGGALSIVSSTPSVSNSYDGEGRARNASLLASFTTVATASPPLPLVSATASPESSHEDKEGGRQVVSSETAEAKDKDKDTSVSNMAVTAMGKALATLSHTPSGTTAASAPSSPESPESTPMRHSPVSPRDLKTRKKREEGGVGAEEEDQTSTVFVLHAGLHLTLMSQIVNAFKGQVNIHLESEYTALDTQERIAKTKDAILRCALVIVVISPQTLTKDLHKDLIFFAEDKGKPVLPLLYSDIDVKSVEFSISRSTLFHFTKKIGFQQSFDLLSQHVFLELLKQKEGSQESDTDSQEEEEEALSLNIDETLKETDPFSSLDRDPGHFDIY